MYVSMDLNLIPWLLLMVVRRALYSVPFASTYSSMTCHQPLMHIQSCSQIMLHFVITARSLQELYDKIIKLFSDLVRYLNMNRLVPNSSKSKLMMFSSRPTQDLPELAFAGEVIEWVDEFKYLGLIITNKLCFANHISRVALNISRITGIFTNVRSIVPYHIVMKLYFALAFPHLMNHVVIWGSAPSCHLKILATRQNNMLRVMSGVKWVDGGPDISTREMYKSNDVMNMNSIFKYCLFKLIRQLLDGRFA